MPDPAIAASADAFKLAAEPTRLAILAALRDGELNVTEIRSRLGLALSQPGLCFHLALLRAAGAVEDRRAGKFNFHGLAERGRLLLAAHDAMAAAGNPRSRKKGAAA